MKKFLAMLVAAMMVLSLVAIPVLADGEVVFAVENAPATATPGDEITVNLTVNGTCCSSIMLMHSSMCHTLAAMFSTRSSTSAALSLLMPPPSPAPCASAS